MTFRSEMIVICNINELKIAAKPYLEYSMTPMFSSVFGQLPPFPLPFLLDEQKQGNVLIDFEYIFGYFDFN